MKGEVGSKKGRSLFPPGFGCLSLGVFRLGMIMIFMVAVARGCTCHCYVGGVVIVVIDASLDDRTDEDSVVSRMCGENGGGH